MEFRPLDITVLSARGLKDVNLMTKMDVYAVVSISGDPRTAQKTPVDRSAGTSPRWDFPMKFTLDDAAANSNRLTLVFKLMSDRAFGDKEIGEVHVPIKELLDGAGGRKSLQEAKERVMSYRVRTPKGKARGTLDFSYRFGVKYTYSAPQPPPPPPPVAKAADEPVMAYPAMAQSGPSTAAAFPPPPPLGGYPQYQPQRGYGYPGYGSPYPPQGSGYPPVQRPKPPKMSGGNFGLGLAGGLLGGLLIGDMIGDATDMAAYDAGYDAGFDNGFDF